MASWKCERATCGATFSVGAPQCPQCGGKKHHEVGAPEPAAKPPAKK